ncbi:hypothetical protein BDR05DRAFT_948948 [Suillus weaverae]|nr:hypothetical protein BDR05DRAFT_948948 [Suillus weaverae]
MVYCTITAKQQNWRRINGKCFATLVVFVPGVAPMSRLQYFCELEDQIWGTIEKFFGRACVPAILPPKRSLKLKPPLPFQASHMLSALPIIAPDGTTQPFALHEMIPERILLFFKVRLLIHCVYYNLMSQNVQCTPELTTLHIFHSEELENNLPEWVYPKCSFTAHAHVSLGTLSDPIDINNDVKVWPGDLDAQKLVYVLAFVLVHIVYPSHPEINSFLVQQYDKYNKWYNKYNNSNNVPAQPEGKSLLGW